MKCLECDFPDIEMGANVAKHYAETGHNHYRSANGMFFSYPVDNEKVKREREPEKFMQKQVDRQEEILVQRDKALLELDQVRTELNTLKPLFSESQEIAKEYQVKLQEEKNKNKNAGELNITLGREIVNLKIELQNVTTELEKIKGLSPIPPRSIS